MVRGDLSAISLAYRLAVANKALQSTISPLLCGSSPTPGVAELFGCDTES